MQTIDEMVRDFTQVMPMPKSEVRRRINKLLAQQKQETVEEVIREINRIENCQSETTPEEWRLFKHIRNNLRDKFIK